MCIIDRLWRYLFQHNWDTSNDLVIGTWDYLYKVIVSCNQSIDKLVMLQKEYPDNELFGTYKSEVRALRAMYYYYLLDMFARVPVVESSTIEIKDVRPVSYTHLNRHITNTATSEPTNR